MKSHEETHTLTFTISPEGQVEGQVEGIYGPDCAGILDRILHGLGKVLSHARTREYRLSAPKLNRHRHTRT